MAKTELPDSVPIRNKLAIAKITISSLLSYVFCTIAFTFLVRLEHNSLMRQIAWETMTRPEGNGGWKGTLGKGRLGILYE